MHHDVHNVHACGVVILLVGIGGILSLVATYELLDGWVDTCIMAIDSFVMSFDSLFIKNTFRRWITSHQKEHDIFRAPQCLFVDAPHRVASRRRMCSLKVQYPSPLRQAHSYFVIHPMGGCALSLSLSRECCAL